MSRATQMEAVYEFFGGVSALLSADAASGATSIEVNASLPLNVPLEVDVGSAQDEETVATAISGTGPYTLTLQAALQYAHSTGAIVGTYETDTTVITGLNTVMRGEPFDIADELLPVMVITVPKSREYRYGGTSKIRGMAQKKGIDYTIRLMVGALLSGPGTADQGAILLDEFYDIIDRIANHIRGSDLATPNDAKQLITASFPSGASVRFGEDFTVQELHNREENTLRIVAVIETLSTEMVNA